MGDLAGRKLISALYQLDLAGLLHEQTRILGVARHKLSQYEFRAGMRNALDTFVKEGVDPDIADRLLATGGSTNETLHLVAIARAAGIRIDWNDFSDLSDAVPLIVRIYPNGSRDINSFQKAGGMPLLIRELLRGGFLHKDVTTAGGKDLDSYLKQPVLEDDRLVWKQGPEKTADPQVMTTTEEPFDPMGGLKLLSGNLGRAIMKISALEKGEHTVVEASAMVFDSQAELETAFHAGRLDRDLVAVVRFQGPRANGMPELHKLITFLSIIMGRGFQAGLVTDGRLSGASGKVPFAIHCSPEAVCGGLLAKVRNGDTILMDASHGRLELKVPEEELLEREYAERGSDRPDPVWAARYFHLSA